ncbi:hypothetical protein B0F90DRAFT_1825772 [Multifurca ochricompacta]|uniref:Uncharacterized protein n=1 Tax=Multifurca ochricompacta TaxID=376703 RepID=A0AAD4LUF0_9AGAM|nr:hypothetical protein B0F90DRAFT_1825772 [Multifurca ochricompacta]
MTHMGILPISNPDSCRNLPASDLTLWDLAHMTMLLIGLILIMDFMTGSLSAIVLKVL